MRPSHSRHVLPTDLVAKGAEAFVSLPKLVEALSRRESHVEVAEWLVQLAYRPRDEGPRADPRRLTKWRVRKL